MIAVSDYSVRTRLAAICSRIHASTSDSIQPMACAASRTGWGDLPSVTRAWVVLRDSPVRGLSVAKTGLNLVDYERDTVDRLAPSTIWNETIHNIGANSWLS